MNTTTTIHFMDFTDAESKLRDLIFEQVVGTPRSEPSIIEGNGTTDDGRKYIFETHERAMEYAVRYGNVSMSPDSSPSMVSRIATFGDSHRTIHIDKDNVVWVQPKNPTYLIQTGDDVIEKGVHSAKTHGVETPFIRLSTVVEVSAKVIVVNNTRTGQKTRYKRSSGSFSAYGRSRSSLVMSEGDTQHEYESLLNQVEQTPLSVEPQIGGVQVAGVIETMNRVVQHNIEVVKGTGRGKLFEGATQPEREQGANLLSPAMIARYLLCQNMAESNITWIDQCKTIDQVLTLVRDQLRLIADEKTNDDASRWFWSTVFEVAWTIKIGG